MAVVAAAVQERSMIYPAADAVLQLSLRAAVASVEDLDVEKERMGITVKVDKRMEGLTERRSSSYYPSTALT